MKLNWIVKSFKNITYHKYCVFLAGLKIGKISIWRLLIHDWTKYLPSEFPHYTRQFHGVQSDKLGFAYCWLKHQNRHEHHWHYWVSRTGSTSEYTNNSPLPMPEYAVREMMADWMGAGKAYSGNWPNVHNWTWLNDNLSKMNIHPDTHDLIIKILKEMQDKEMRM